MAGDDQAIRSILVAGGGITGWSAAAALRRKLPRVALTVLPLAPPPDALADRSGGALPSITEFHHDLGLTEADTVARAGSGLRLGTSFEGWARGRPDYVHAYGEYGRPFGTASFHHHWVRAVQAGEAAPFDGHSAAAAIGRAGRFAQPEGAPGSPLAGFLYGLALNPPRYRELMRAYARHLGALEQPGEIAGVRLDGKTGTIAGLGLADGREIRADLYIDCTGPRALLRGALDVDFEDWSAWLPCDRLLHAEAPPPADPPTLDRAIATAAGWRWEMASPARTSRGLVYASAYMTDDEAAAALGGGAAPIALRQGRRPMPWRRNCVAVGDAAVAVEPLEWTNLHLAHSAIDRIAAMLPGRDFAEVELAEYNRQAGAEADRARDFLAVHYLAADRAEPFWRAAASAVPPPSLAHTLGLFRERGRLPFHEEETFSRDSWAAVLIGQGVIPRRADPLIDPVAPEDSARAMTQWRAAIAAVAATLPTQAAYLQQLARETAR
jgi:tryptophan halogenase